MRIFKEPFFIKLICEKTLVLLLSASLIYTYYVIQGNIGIDLGDEGYLWYGAIQTYLGSIPLLDFQSYEPGRYYWISLWFKIFNSTSLIALKIATLLFFFIGLSCALLVVRKYTSSWWYTIILGLCLTICAFPSYRLFDISLSMILVYIILFLLEKPNRTRFFVTGVVIGIAAYIGSNHGLYYTVAVILAAIYIYYKIKKKYFQKGIFFLVLGVILGYSPRWVMFILKPETFFNYLEMVKWLFNLGSTNIPLPIPWPWTVTYVSLPSYLWGVTIGCLFIVIIILPIFLCFYSFIRRKHFVLAACSFAGLPYIHLAISRADIVHLSQAIAPLILCIGYLIIFFCKNKKLITYFALVSMLIFFMFTIGRVQPAYNLLTDRVGNFTELKLDQHVLGDTMLVSNYHAELIYKILDIRDLNLGEGENFFIAPHTPMIYPLLNTKSPIWDIYLLFPESKQRQLEQIEELDRKNVSLVILADNALDGRDDLRFKNTHPILYNYFYQSFQEIDSTGLPENYVVLKRIK